jgi:hypothetical protein
MSLAPDEFKSYSICAGESSTIRRVTPRFRAAAAVAGITNLLAAAGLGALAPGTPINADAAARLQFIHANRAAWCVGWILWIPTAIALAIFYRELARGLSRIWILACVCAAVDISLIFVMIVWVPAATPQTLPGIERVYELGAGLGVNGVYTIVGLVLNIVALRAGTIPRRRGWFGMIVWPCGVMLSVTSLLHLPMLAACAGAATLLTFSAWCLSLSRR